MSHEQTQPGPSARSTVGLLEAVAELLVDAYPEERPETVVTNIRTWGRQLAARIAPDMSTRHRLTMLQHFFFDELGFHGNVDGYDDAENSYLNRVIERRTGIPISLSLIYIELGSAIGLRLGGVSFPGHFLVRAPLTEGVVILDVFNGGLTLSEQDLRKRLHAALQGEPARPLTDYLRAASDADILVRWLRNLKALYASAGNWNQLLKVMHRLIAAVPDVPDERLVRALAYERLRCPRAAADELETYLRLHPQAADSAALRARLDQLQRATRSLH
ncbi:MAG: SirB1 family protein [Burkholderiaceae bacterium]